MNVPAAPRRAAGRPADGLAGSLRLKIGQPVPNVELRRVEIAPALAAGRDPRRVPDLLACVFTLCGHAHRLAGHAAVAAAMGTYADTAPAHTRSLLCEETLREHLRRIWLDWPRAMSEQARAALCPVDAIAALAASPAMQASRGDAGSAQRASRLSDWLRTHALGSRPEHWLACWHAAPEDWLDEWSATCDTWPARWLRHHRDVARSIAEPLHPLTPHACPAALDALADALREDAGFAAAPHEGGMPRETGCWTRLHDRPAIAGAAPVTLWLRLSHRIAELARLALADPDAGTAAAAPLFGAHAPAPGEGIGWVETSRGLLVHWIGCNPEQRTDAAPTVANYRVIAPTDWNFHPQGAVARMLARLSPDDGQAAALLVATFDPCVTTAIDTPAERCDA